MHTSNSEEALVKALETVLANTMEELIERQLLKLLHDPQVKLALEKLAMKNNTSLEEAAKIYLSKVISIADESAKSPVKLKKMVASLKKPEA